jgi:hypothetical protein
MYQQLLGPPPVLNAVEETRFWKFFARIVAVLEPSNMEQVNSIWHHFCSEWVMNRSIRLGTVAVEQRAKARKARKEALIRMKTKRFG